MTRKVNGTPKAITIAEKRLLIAFTILTEETMNATLRCGKCGNDFVVTGCNIARAGMKCPVADCGFPNSILQMLENFYGSTLMKLIKQDVEFMHRAKVNDNYPYLLARTEQFVQAAIDAVVEFAAKKAKAEAA
jgi:hypothetical protein